MTDDTMTATSSEMIDAREQLFNDRLVGQIHEVQIPAERITALHGLMIDLDPKLYLPGNPYFPPDDDPRTFYANIKPVLGRHPLARHAEVRMSGSGLHVIVWLKPPVEFRPAAEQQRWGHLVRVVQCSLPGDPDAPGITAVTRPVGSINSKNGAKVAILKAGEHVAPDTVVEFASRLSEAPFREMVLALLGQQRVSPCPVCRGPGTRLDVLERHGWCYGGCGRVDAGTILDLIYSPDPPAAEGASGQSNEPQGFQEEGRQQVTNVTKPPTRKRKGKVSGGLRARSRGTNQGQSGGRGRPPLRGVGRPRPGTREVAVV